GLAVERDRQRLARLSDVRRLGRDLERALAEAQPERRVLLREEADPAHDLEQLGGAHPQLVLEGLREQLLVVREPALHEPRRQRDVPKPEYHLVLERRDLDVAPRAPSRDAPELLERPGWHVRLERAVERLLERGFFDTQAVRIGGDHAQLAIGG